MQPAPQDMQLMSEHRVLSLEPYLRLEWRGQDGQSETEQPDHSASLGDSITSSTRIRFSVHTGPHSSHLLNKGIWRDSDGTEISAVDSDGTQIDSNGREKYIRKCKIFCYRDSHQSRNESDVVSVSWMVDSCIPIGGFLHYPSCGCLLQRHIQVIKAGTGPGADGVACLGLNPALLATSAPP
jgi:hypothetical protein